MPRIYNPDGTFEDIEHINFYLLNGPDIFVKSRSTPLCPVPKIIKGSQPTDNGNLILSEEEKNCFIEKYPKDKKFIRQLMGAEDFLHNKKDIVYGLSTRRLMKLGKINSFMSA